MEEEEEMKVEEGRGFCFDKNLPFESRCQRTLLRKYLEAICLLLRKPFLFFSIATRQTYFCFCFCFIFTKLFFLSPYFKDIFMIFVYTHTLLVFSKEDIFALMYTFTVCQTILM